MAEAPWGRGADQGEGLLKHASLTRERTALMSILIPEPSDLLFVQILQGQRRTR